MRRTKRQCCSYCRVPLIGDPAFSISLYGFGVGPLMPLCKRCGTTPLHILRLGNISERSAKLLGLT